MKYSILARIICVCVCVCVCLNGLRERFQIWINDWLIENGSTNTDTWPRPIVSIPLCGGNGAIGLPRLILLKMSNTPTDFKYGFSSHIYLLDGLFKFEAPLIMMFHNSAIFGWKWLKFWKSLKTDFRFRFSKQNYLLDGLWF